jgi:integrase
MTVGRRRIVETFSGDRARERAEAFAEVPDLDRRLQRHGLLPLSRRRLRLLDAIAAYLAHAEQRWRAGLLRDATLNTYTRKLAPFRVWLEDVERRPGLYTDEFNAAAVARFAAWRLAEPVSPRARRRASDSQVRRNLLVLWQVHFWSKLKRGWKIPKTLRARLGGRRTLPAEKLWSFLAAMFVGSPERTVPELATATGRCPGDIRGLRRGDVDLAARLIRWQVHKSRRPQVVAIGDDLARHLEAWLAAQEPGAALKAQRRATFEAEFLFYLDGRPLQVTTLH